MKNRLCFVFAVPVRANKDIWIFGDTFLTEAVAVLRELQNLNRDELYLYSEYDPQIYYPKLLDKDTFASQVRCQLFTALEEHNKLPAVIIVVLGNGNVDDKVLNPECTRKVWSALFTLIQRTIRTRKEDLPSKAKSPNEPKIYVSNMFPRFKDHNDKTDLTDETFKTKRRRFNGLLPQIALNFEYKVLPINGILPDNANLFTVNTGQLNGKGMKEFWLCLSRELKIQDFRLKEQSKNAVVQEFFEQQREQRRLAQEKRRAKNDRYSLPRNAPQTHNDRGDAGFPDNNRRHRAHSVPNRNVKN